MMRWRMGEDLLICECETNRAGDHVSRIMIFRRAAVHQLARKSNGLIDESGFDGS
jgi:hypothetical protein